MVVEVPGKPPVELKPGEVLIGRSRHCALQIAEATVSRQHARLLVGPDGKVRLEDLGSSNGTFVNGERVTGTRDLANGDRLMVGEVEMRISILPPLGPAEATLRVELPPLDQLELQAPPQLPEPISRPEGGATPPPPPQAPQPSAPLPGPELGPPPSRPVPPVPLPPPAPAPSPPPAPVAPRALAGSPVTVPPPAPLPRPAGPAPARPPAPSPAQKGPPAPAAEPRGDLLPSIAEIDKMPLPPPAAGRAKTGPAPLPKSGREQAAGFWIRVAANLIDGALVGAAYLLTALLMIGLGYVLPSGVVLLLSMALGFLVVFAAYFLLLLYLPATKGQTPGKKVFGLWIVGESTRPGAPLGWSTAFLRWLGHFVCSLTAGIGYLMIAFTEKKQGLHDLIAKTRVVRLV